MLMMMLMQVAFVAVQVEVEVHGGPLHLRNYTLIRRTLSRIKSLLHSTLGAT